MRNVSRVLVFGVLALALGGCGDLMSSFGPQKPPERPPAPVIPVEASLPERGTIHDFYDTTSRIEAEDKVNVIPEAIQRCLRVFAEEGDTVTKGKVLAELDTDEILTQIHEARSQVAKQRSDAARAEQMWEEGLGPKAEFDNAKYALEQGEASLARLDLQLANLTIRAPIGGIVTMRDIQPGQMVPSGSPVFHIVDPLSYILVVNPPEQEVGRLRVGQVAEVTLDAVADEVFEAKVRKISPHVDSGSGTVKVILDFARDAMGRLRDSAFARVRLVMETHENVLLVPKDAIVDEAARKYLFVLKDKAPEEAADSEDEASEADVSEEDSESDEQELPSGRTYIAERVEIEAGLEDSNFVEILSGIEDDSLIITLGQQTLKPGSEVRVTNAEAELYAKAEMSAEEALEAAKKEREKGAKETMRRHGPGRRR